MSNGGSDEHLGLGHSVLDLKREQRTGAPEAIFAEGKSWETLRDIVQALTELHRTVLVTRLTEGQQRNLSDEFSSVRFCRSKRTAIVGRVSTETTIGRVAIVSAGSSDAKVADEAELSGEYMGVAVQRFNDVGVAGLSRLLNRIEEIRQNDVVIVIAGMEAALASVLAGLVPIPVVAVPTSVGYGATFGGVTALLSMLVSCSPGISVVNIDNGYGAMMSAVRMLGLKALPEPTFGD
jgi:NCAIR mutase (PurE)-related protein